MKKIFLTIAVVAYCGIALFAQTPSWKWAKTAIGSAPDVNNSVTTDTLGNVYITGGFRSNTITFDTITLFNSEPYTTSDVFIVKYDSSGNVQWAKSIGSTGSWYYDDIGICIKVDLFGNSYVTGYFDGISMSFGNGITLANADTLGGHEDIFLAKLDPDGTCLWAQSIGGTLPDIVEGASLDLDQSGNVYLTGRYQNSLVSIGGNILNYFGSSDIFLAKFDTNGNVMWANGFGGTDMDWHSSLTIDKSENIFLAGSTRNSSINLDTITILGPCYFLAKFNSSGNIIWAKSTYADVYDITGNDITVDNLGNIYSVGIFNTASAIFGNDSLINADTINHTHDIFAVKYDSLGNPIWAKCFGGNYADYGNSIAVNSIGNIYIAGDYKSSSINFENYTISNYASPRYDIFICELSSGGNVLNAINIGADSSDFANSIIVDKFDNIFLAGEFRSNFLTFGNIALSASGQGDVFTARLDTLPVFLFAIDTIQTIPDTVVCCSQQYTFNIITQSYTDSTFQGSLSYRYRTNHMGPNDFGVFNPNTQTDTIGPLGTLSRTITFSFDTTSSAGFKIGGNVVVVWPVTSTGPTVIAIDTFITSVFVSILTDIEEEINTGSYFNVYPNPANEVINISLSPTCGPIEHVRITDILGRERYFSNKVITSLSSSFLEQGIYFIEIKEKNRISKVKKIIITN